MRNRHYPNIMNTLSGPEWVTLSTSAMFLLLFTIHAIRAKFKRKGRSTDSIHGFRWEDAKAKEGENRDW